MGDRVRGGVDGGGRGAFGSGGRRRRLPLILVLLLLLVCLLSASNPGVGGSSRKGEPGGTKEEGDEYDGGEDRLGTEVPSLERLRLWRRMHDHHRVRLEIGNSGAPLEGRSMFFGISTVAVKNAILVPSGQAVVVAMQPDRSPFDVAFNGSVFCASSIENIVVSPNGSWLYYKFMEMCMDTVTKTMPRMRCSFRKANLTSPLPPRGVSGAERGGTVLSYWWSVANTSGEASLSPTVDSAPSSTVPPMVNLIGCGMDMSKPGRHLLVGTGSLGLRKPTITFLDTLDGHRVGIGIDVDDVSSVALDPTETRLYVSDEIKPCRILSAKMRLGAEVDIPRNSTMSFVLEKNFADGDVSEISNAVFGAHSFDPNGSCLYFADATNYILWTMNLSSPLRNLTRVAGSGEKGQTDGEAMSSSFTSMTYPIVTRDGCNVFIGDNDKLRWVALDSPCSTARAVSTVAKIDATLIQGTTLRETDSSLSLFFSTMDGLVYKLDIERSALHACATPSSPDPPSPNPPATIYPPPLSPHGSTSTPNSIGIVPPASSYATPYPPLGDSQGKADESGVGVVVIIAPVVCGSIIVLVAVGGLLLYCRQRTPARTPSALDEVPRSSAVSEVAVPSDCGVGSGTSALHPAVIRAFALAALRRCTNGFDPEYLIGERGAFGAVYWGSLEDKEVAIKVMDGELTAAKRRQFVAEVNTLSRLHHANLIELMGYCDEGNRSILVYPFFRGGSLHSRLHNRRAMRETDELPPLTLAERMSIASQIAEGLRYLHYGANPRIIHRDIKSSNVLLSDGFGANLRVVLADFGLAAISGNVFQEGHDSAVRTAMAAGTRGYMAPEYVLRGRLTAKNDVYAFGVILLELLTGKPAIVAQDGPQGEVQTLAAWAKGSSDPPNLNHILGTVVDSCLRREVQESITLRNMAMDTVSLGMDCCQDNDEKRPTMSSACERLASIVLELKKPR